jgi:prepilin signal peptidase PulO-like enzyme (type II secretory pathway)
MDIFWILFAGAAVFGAILGSFLNALSFRFNTGKSIFFSSTTGAARSRCMHCGATLGPADLVPIFSFLFLRGRCRHCGSLISWQYPLVEAAAAALSVLAFVAHPAPAAYAFWLLVWMVLLFVVVYDIRHGIIPWSCSILLAVLGVAGILFGFVSQDIWQWAAGPALAAPLAFISLISGGRWMGWGDGALELSLGWLLGPTAGFTALMIAFWSGAIVGIVALALSKKVTMKTEVPFAPFLILGALVAHFFNVDFFSVFAPLF